MGYPGGKGGAGVFQLIINEMPPHRVYIEAMVGGGSVLRHKRPAERNVAVDLSGPVIDKWRSWKPSSNAELRAWGADGAHGVEAVHGCGIDYLAGFRFTGAELVYCDPPYVRSSRRTSRPLYEHEMTDDDHERLLSVLLDLPCPVLVSGYWSELYARRLAGWRVVEYESTTRSGRKAMEYLWLNFPAAAALHDYRHLGDDYRDRERIKRKVDRWRGKLAGLDPLEQRAIVSALLEQLEGESEVSDLRRSIELAA
jgi:DNA adenine methylase